MKDILGTLVPMLMFMLIPVWIPIIAVVAAWVGELFAAITGRVPEQPPFVVARQAREAARADRLATAATQS